MTLMALEHLDPAKTTKNWVNINVRFDTNLKLFAIKRQIIWIIQCISQVLQRISLVVQVLTCFTLNIIKLGREVKFYFATYFITEFITNGFQQVLGVVVEILKG